MGDQRRIALFYSINTSGHINPSIRVADQLKNEFNYRTIFMLLGEPLGTRIRDHGHELLVLEEMSPLEDYPISDEESETTDVDRQVHKPEKKKRKFLGYQRITHLANKMGGSIHVGSGNSLVELMYYLNRELMDNNEKSIATIEYIKPDIVIADVYMAPPWLVNLEHIPWVRLNSMNPLDIYRSKLPGGVKPAVFVGCKLFTKSERERIRREDPIRWQRILDEWKINQDRIVNARKDVYCPELRAMYKFGMHRVEEPYHYSPHLNFYVFPEELDYDKDDDILELPHGWVRCDSLIERATTNQAQDLAPWADRLDEALKDNKPLVLFSFGTIASGCSKMVEKFVDMLRGDTERLYVVSKGPNGGSIKLDPANMIGGNFIPQVPFTKRADLAIIHGGNNSVTECLYYGVPMIVLPMQNDQFDNAQRIEDLELGKRVDPGKCSREALMQAIGEVLADKDMKDRLRGIGERMRAKNDARKVATIIHKMVARKMRGTDLIRRSRTESPELIEAR